MQRHFELAIVSTCLIATFLTIFAVPGMGDGLRPGPPDGMSVIGQYISTMMVTLVAVAVLNRYRDQPLNRWRAVMLLVGVVLIGNLVIVWFFRAALAQLRPEAVGGFIADATSGGWFVLIPAWIASARWKRRARAALEWEPIGRE